MFFSPPLLKKCVLIAKADLSSLKKAVVVKPEMKNFSCK